VADIRRQAMALGRKPDEILFFLLATVIVGRTEQEAREKYDDYLQYISLEGALTGFSASVGMDLSKLSLDEPLPRIKNDAALHSVMESLSLIDPNKTWTLRDIARHSAIGSRGPTIVGSPEQVADTLQGWIADTDIDGFNLSYAVMPGDFEDFVEMVVPELQRRGVYKTAYSQGTLREKLYGVGKPTLPDDHPAARHRVQR
jgi:alkanesulfonate monooxygenase SsuD/methylene tetrahydromethanopterin reductase-like flavin-dependent oxidoreductase (luciferase family)